MCGTPVSNSRDRVQDFLESSNVYWWKIYTRELVNDFYCFYLNYITVLAFQHVIQSFQHQIIITHQVTKSNSSKVTNPSASRVRCKISWCLFRFYEDVIHWTQPNMTDSIGFLYKVFNPIDYRVTWAFARGRHYQLSWTWFGITETLAWFLVSFQQFPADSCLPNKELCITWWYFMDVH